MRSRFFLCLLSFCFLLGFELAFNCSQYLWRSARSICGNPSFDTLKTFPAFSRVKQKGSLPSITWVITLVPMLHQLILLTMMTFLDIISSTLCDERVRYLKSKFEEYYVGRDDQLKKFIPEYFAENFGQEAALDEATAAIRESLKVLMRTFRKKDLVLHLQSRRIKFQERSKVDELRRLLVDHALDNPNDEFHHKILLQPTPQAYVSTISASDRSAVEKELKALTKEKLRNELRVRGWFLPVHQISKKQHLCDALLEKLFPQPISLSEHFDDLRIA